MRAAAVVTVALSLSATAACGRDATRHQPLPPDRATEVLHDRVWLDHAPRGMTDKFHVALFAPGGAAIAQHRTVWKGEFEVFFHEVDGRELTFFLPASGTEMRSSFHIEPLSEHAKADMLLTIDHPPTGPREYLGFPSDGGAVDAAAIDAWLARRYPARR